jgi:fibrillarin-like pre-rRNA processing protein
VKIDGLNGVRGAPGVFTDGEELFTMNGAPWKNVYGERLIDINGIEFRHWDPHRSKLAAMILLGGRNFGLDPSSKVLYLGAASGTTASHISDIATGGVVWCVEISERSFRDLVKVCEVRKNMIPILADANTPHEYGHMIEGVELVYQDVAQRNQVEIFVRNMAAFEAGKGILMLKSRSINVNRNPKSIYAEVKKQLSEACLKVRHVIDLEKYAKDHAAFVVEE